MLYSAAPQLMPTSGYWCSKQSRIISSDLNKITTKARYIRKKFQNRSIHFSVVALADSNICQNKYPVNYNFLLEKEK